MRFVSLLLLLLCLYGTASAQEELIIDSKKVNYAYGELVKERRAPISQVNFVAAFPATKKQFLDVFYPVTKYQLYEDRAVYIAALQQIAVAYPKQVLSRIIKIGIDMNPTGDIIEQIQTLVLDLGAKRPDVFVEEVNKMKKKEVIAVAKFLSLSQGSAYQSLIAAIQTQKADKIATVFISEGQKNAVHE